MTLRVSPRRCPDQARFSAALLSGILALHLLEPACLLPGKEDCLTHANDPSANASITHAIRATDDAEESRFHRCGGVDPGAWDWRQHGDFQRGQCTCVAAAASQRSQPDC